MWTVIYDNLGERTASLHLARKFATWVLSVPQATRAHEQCWIKRNRTQHSWSGRGKRGSFVFHMVILKILWSENYKIKRWSLNFCLKSVYIVYFVWSVWQSGCDQHSDSRGTTLDTKAVKCLAHVVCQRTWDTLPDKQLSLSIKAFVGT